MDNLIFVFDFYSRLFNWYVIPFSYLLTILFFIIVFVIICLVVIRKG